MTDVSGSELRPAFVVERLQNLFPDLRLEREPADKAYRLTAVGPAMETAGREPGGVLWQYFQQTADSARRLDAMARAAGRPAGQAIA